jgi:hypothetical protein
MRELLNIRNQNQNGSLGITIPNNVKNEYGLDAGRYIAEINSKDGKLVIELDLESFYKKE